MPISEIEPNNNIATANPIGLGTPVLGQLMSSTELDFFLVTAPALKRPLVSQFQHGRKVFLPAGR